MRPLKNTVLWSRNTDFYCLYPFLVFLLLCGWAILVPVFRAARSPLKQSTCLSNLKQLCLSTTMYSADWEDILPRSDRWVDLTSKFQEDEKAFRCPSVKDGEYGYAFMDRLSAKNLAYLTKPKEQLMIIESSDLRRNAHGDKGLLPNPPRHTWNAVGYADGHSGFFKARETP